MVKYPVGIQSFEKLRTGGFLYVDKTRLMYEAAQNNFVFLSRTRTGRPFHRHALHDVLLPQPLCLCTGTHSERPHGYPAQDRQLRLCHGAEDGRQRRRRTPADRRPRLCHPLRGRRPQDREGGH